MNFGYVTDDAVLDRIDFTLPQDHPGNARILAAGKPHGERLFVGCAEYRVKEWKGLLYPEKTKEGDMLHLYTSQFRVMEMNGTHYKIYPPTHVAKWADAAATRNFLFCRQSFRKSSLTKATATMHCRLPRQRLLKASLHSASILVRYFWT